MPNPVLTPERWEKQANDDKAGWAAPATGAAGMAGGFGATHRPRRRRTHRSPARPR